MLADPLVGYMEVEWGIKPWTVREVSSGVWFAFREESPIGVIRGIYWRMGDYRPVLLIAANFGGRGMCWETVSPMSPAMICEHATHLEADRCAVRRLFRGRTCREGLWSRLRRRAS